MKPDPGLARERTELAWLRTAISLAALGAVVAKTALVTGLLILGIGAVVWTVSRVSRTSGRTPGGPRRVQLIMVANVVVAVAALAVSLQGRGGSGLW